jgi:hypothetical protein
MQAIQTQFCPGADGKPAYLVATGPDGSRTWTAWNRLEDIRQNHERACRSLIRECGWDGCVAISGAMHDGAWAHVLIPESWLPVDHTARLSLSESQGAAR